MLEISLTALAKIFLSGLQTANMTHSYSLFIDNMHLRMAAELTWMHVCGQSEQHCTIVIRHNLDSYWVILFSHSIFYLDSLCSQLHVICYAKVMKKKVIKNGNNGRFVNQTKRICWLFAEAFGQ